MQWIVPSASRPVQASSRRAPAQLTADQLRRLGRLATETLALASLVVSLCAGLTLLSWLL
ncbi:MAG: hypothetical protein HND55_05830 [Pseudomonadota bacterium]|nr:MAG: hypothetical protein HND55_05830 [Pseudomonadota bacterium]